MISTRDLSKLPDIDNLKRLMQSMAMLDAILSPEWQYRYYSFNSKWSKGEQMGSMRDGCGDDLFALFNKHGCFIKGFAHEAPMSPYREQPPKLWPGIIDTVPRCFASALREPAFDMEATTFCIWRQYTDKQWQRGDIKFPKGTDPDGSKSLLSPFDGKPRLYLKWAHDYFDISDAESHLTLDHVRHVYDYKPLTTELVQQMNPEITLRSLAKDIAEIGYPKNRLGKK